MRRTTLFVRALAVALFLVFAGSAYAQSQMNKTVRVQFKDGRRPLVGKVVFEGEDELTLKLAWGLTKVKREEIDHLEDLEPLVQEYEKRLKDAKTGEELYQLGVWVEKNGLESKLRDDTFDKAIAAETNHEAARKARGWEKTSDGRGGVAWVRRDEAGKRQKIGASLGKADAETRHRNWDDMKLVVRRPEKRPEYEITTNCPKELAERYADFMVKLRASLVDLIQKAIGQPIAWQRMQCTACGGSGKEGTKACPRCGGSSQEPSKIYILNSQKYFMEVTGQREGVGGFYGPRMYPPADCERPIISFHGTFGLSNDTYNVLGHEGTHQLEHLMWKGDFQSRPPWMIEGLAVYFGDGLDRAALAKTEFKVDIPRDRLSGLKRALKSGQYAKIRDFTLCQYSAYQQNPILYNHAWSLIYYMLHSGQSFEFKGKKFDLKAAFAKFFLKNTEDGFPMLASFLGAENEQDMNEVLAKLETGWKDYVLKLPIKPLYAVKGKLYNADDLNFELAIPKKKKGSEWAPVADEDLGWGDAIRIAVPDGSAKVTVVVEQNAKLLETDRAVEEALRVIKIRYEDLKVVKREPVSHKGLAAVALELQGKEREHPMLAKNRPTPQHAKVLVMATPKRIYQVFGSADEEKWDAAKGELDEILEGFRVTGG